VWGDQYDGLSNTIEVHVKELRRKLEELGPRVIQTRRGQGYVLEAGTSAE
jgi:two-component system response regulator MprA